LSMLLLGLGAALSFTGIFETWQFLAWAQLNLMAGFMLTMGGLACNITSFVLLFARKVLVCPVDPQVKCLWQVKKDEKKKSKSEE